MAILGAGCWHLGGRQRGQPEIVCDRGELKTRLLENDYYFTDQFMAKSKDVFTTSPAP